ncbi:hypothetical protein VP01_1117g9 [Puccinia sorghi]|uniref:Uncharacterized protein n=1 Tax=Puccinia sorghi TaxID=27349 RepID=A0A0L6VSJ1_9BASI|nr:hypothetical protein VP01_1117g9 [Puccinia sorghi]
MPQLPCLIPLFDPPRSLLEHYQRNVVEVGSRGQSLSTDGALDAKTAQLLDIQNCPMDCCAKLARYINGPHTPSDLQPAPRGPAAPQYQVPHVDRQRQRQKKKLSFFLAHIC